MAIIVKARSDESTDNVIKRFKRRVISDNLLQLLKKKEFYMKPALLRKEAKKDIQRRKHAQKREAQGLSTPRRRPMRRRPSAE